MRENQLCWNREREDVQRSKLTCLSQINLTFCLQTFIGTKKAVEAHIKEVATCLDYVRTATDVSLEEKRAFFRAVNKHYGSSALCLSGGASFGYYQYELTLVYAPGRKLTGIYLLVSVLSKPSLRPTSSLESSLEHPQVDFVPLSCVRERIASSRNFWSPNWPIRSQHVQIPSGYGSSASGKRVLDSILLSGRGRLVPLDTQGEILLTKISPCGSQEGL